jgi:tetratricopeptide (TPR) repeat protein
VAEKKNRLFTMMPADPWAKLAAAYHFADNQEAVKALLKRHPGAASFKGDIHAANRLWEPAIAEYTSLISKERPDAGLSAKLAQAYQASDRTRQAIPFLAILSAANPDDTNFTMKVAALQAWFGQEKELAETCARGLELAKNTSSAGTAERTAKICCLLPTQDKTGAASALVLARKAVELGKADSLLPWFQMALGMAEYRNGRFADADVTLSAATREGRGMLTVPDTSAFFRAMSLYQQGKKDEAKKLASEAAATMKPLPKDEQNPLSGDASHDALILWLAYKEAQAMIKFAAAPAAMSQPEGK